MKRKSRWIGLLLALVMVFSFVACGETPTNTEDVPTVSAEEPVDAEPKNVLIFEHEYFTISFVGTEEHRWEGEVLVFYVENKTDYELTFQGDSLAIDGESLGYISGSDSIAPQSRGKVRFSTEEAFPTMTPNTLSGKLRAIDFSYELLERSMEFSFVNVEV